MRLLPIVQSVLDNGNLIVRRGLNGSYVIRSSGHHRASERGDKFVVIPYPSVENSPTKILLNNITETEIRSPGLFPECRQNTSIKFKCPDRAKYLQTVRALKEHIARGDIYEINYCVEFHSEEVTIDPFRTFFKLDSISRAPHACLVRLDKTWILCSSPERFLKKKGNKLITQPIKGTAARGKTIQEDERFKNDLSNSLKEQTENVMIVDVARNDLSRLAKKRSVQVEELFGIYTFEQVHQMISTVSCELKNGISFEEIIAATFPMASMTGAPKIRAMQLIREYEDFDRGFYSGSIGIVEPNGDFDLNVVIRSIVYDEEKKTVSFAVGSAITALSNPEQEWEECMLKAKAMIEVLS
jgi:para-aminobenzoate synthetase component I